MRHIYVAMVLGAFTLVVDTNAWPEPIQPIEPPASRGQRGALEVGASAGFAQGAGDIDAKNRSSGQLTGAGIALALDAGYKLTPAWTLGGVAQYEGFAAGDPYFAGSPSGLGLQSVAITFAVTNHLQPGNAVDPWLQLGTGYRLLWLDDPGSAVDRLQHGPELGKLAGGLDLTIADRWAFGPQVGVDLDMFIWGNRDGGADIAVLDHKAVSVFVYAGFRVSVDLGGRAGATTRQHATRK